MGFCTCCDSADDMLPMWVADMDFRSPPEVMEAVLAASGSSFSRVVKIVCFLTDLSNFPIVNQVFEHYLT